MNCSEVRLSTTHGVNSCFCMGPAVTNLLQFFTQSPDGCRPVSSHSGLHPFDLICDDAKEQISARIQHGLQEQLRLYIAHKPGELVMYVPSDWIALISTSPGSVPSFTAFYELNGRKTLTCKPNSGFALAKSNSGFGPYRLKCSRPAKDTAGPRCLLPSNGFP